MKTITGKQAEELLKEQFPHVMRAREKFTPFCDELFAEVPEVDEVDVILNGGDIVMKLTRKNRMAALAAKKHEEN